VRQTCTIFSLRFNKRIVDGTVPFEIHLQRTGNRNFVGLVPPYLLFTSTVFVTDSGGSTNANIANVLVYFPGDSKDWNVKICLFV